MQPGRRLCNNALGAGVTQWYGCVVIPQVDVDGLLPAGIHWATRDEFVIRFGISPRRQQVMAGLRAALDSLKAAGCKTVYLDGSFVTSKEVPNDFDAC